MKGLSAVCGNIIGILHRADRAVAVSIVIVLASLLAECANSVFKLVVLAQRSADRACAVVIPVSTNLAAYAANALFVGMCAGLEANSAKSVCAIGVRLASKSANRTYTYRELMSARRTAVCAGTVIIGVFGANISAGKAKSV